MVEEVLSLSGCSNSWRLLSYAKDKQRDILWRCSTRTCWKHTLFFENFLWLWLQDCFFDFLILEKWSLALFNLSSWKYDQGRFRLLHSSFFFTIYDLRSWYSLQDFKSVFFNILLIDDPLAPVWDIILRFQFFFLRINQIFNDLTGASLRCNFTFSVFLPAT